MFYSITSLESAQGKHQLPGVVVCGGFEQGMNPANAIIRDPKRGLG